MPESFASRKLHLRTTEKVGDVVVLEVSRLLEHLLRNGADISSGDIRIRKDYDPNYLADELLVTWDKR